MKIDDIVHSKTIQKNGINYFLLHASNYGNVKCPFCNKNHKHGIAGGNGHRIAHCSNVVNNPVIYDGKEHWQQAGYCIYFE
jgi:hypothetical protein